MTGETREELFLGVHPVICIDGVTPTRHFKKRTSAVKQADTSDNHLKPKSTSETKMEVTDRPSRSLELNLI